MKNTEFLSPTEKGKLIELAKNNDKAVTALFAEFDRLENRIRNLEIVISVAIDKAPASLPDYNKLLPIIHS